MPAVLSTVAKGVRKVLDKYPVTRGMVAYAVLWPAGNLVQQGLDGSRTSFDLWEALRYGLYGSCINAPLLYRWIKTVTFLIPGNSLRHAIAKGYVDQLVFAPFNISQFFLGMSLLEGKAVDESICEWQDKMLPTWLVSLSIWPILQTLNFSLVPEKNRVMAISLGSFFWMVFLSYVHHTRAEDLPAELTTRRVHYDYKHGPREAIETGWGSVFGTTAHCYSVKNEKPSPEARDVIVTTTGDSLSCANEKGTPTTCDVIKKE
ncbi:Mpv17-like protein [Penaeus vannamei]|uniref:Mpv17-like protein n=1 Tax=Penaeus vannamei TaxID=6689 RepID=A0A423TWM5_PENVA|nr:Mpv17-like protein [Penaeus vannamei]